MPPASSLTSQLARRITDTIRRRKLAEGAFFMTEEQIAQRFGASRRVAREAVAHLTSLGVLRSRRGQGISVGKPDPTRLLHQTVPFYIQSDQDFWDLAELRYCLEVGVADVAATNASNEQIQRLQEIARQFQKTVGPKMVWDQVIELECAFHGQILQATGNRLIVGMHSVILDFFVAQRAAPPDIKSSQTQELAQQAANEHMSIAECFASRDGAKAAELLRKHLAVSNLRPTDSANAPAIPSVTP